MIESNSVPSLQRIIMISKETKPGTITFDEAMSCGGGLQVTKDPKKIKYDGKVDFKNGWNSRVKLRKSRKR